MSWLLCRHRLIRYRPPARLSLDRVVCVGPWCSRSWLRRRWLRWRRFSRCGSSVRCSTRMSTFARARRCWTILRCAPLSRATRSTRSIVASTSRPSSRTCSPTPPTGSPISPQLRSARPRTRWSTGRCAPRCSWVSGRAQTGRRTRSSCAPWWGEAGPASRPREASSGLGCARSSWSRHAGSGWARAWLSASRPMRARSRCCARTS